MLILGLAILLLLSILLVSLSGNKWAQITLAIVLGLFWCAQLSSVYIGESFIDYRYYQHFDLKTLAMVSAFKWEAVLMVILLAGIPFALFHGGRFLRSRLSTLGRGKAAGVKALLTVSMLGMLTFPADSMYRKLAEAITIVTTDVAEENSLSLQITPKEDLQVTACAGKNIIIISLESFSKAMLHPINRGLTPYLQQRATQWAYHDMQHSNNTSFTIGSLYATFTGLPPFFAGTGNEFFHGAAHSKLISLADIVNKCHYDTYHLSNNASFAGTRELLTALGVRHVWDDLTEMKYPASPMSGAYDRDIFNEAKDIVRRRGDAPFMMFIATTQTHGPNGFVDERMLEVVEPESDSFETAIKCTDWLVEDFIQFLHTEDILGNTAVYILPDHAFWSDKEVLTRAGDDRMLWCMTNTDAFAGHPGQLYQIDLPKIILRGAGIEHNAVFLTDLIEGDPHTFINRHLQEITALNTASIVREKTLGESLTVRKRWGRLECRMNGEVVFSDRLFRLRGKHITFALNENLKYRPAKVYSEAEYADGYYDPHVTHIDIHCRGRVFDFTWTSDDRLHSLRRERLTRLTLDANDIVNTQRKLVSNALVAADPIDKVRRLAHDTPPFEGCVLDYLPRVMEDPDKLLLIYAYDEASIHADKLRPLFQSLGLQEDLTGKYRWAYTAVLSRDTVYFEKARPSALHRKLHIAGNAVSITSSGFDDITPGEYTNHLLINDCEYAYPSRGLNFTVYDLATRQTTDAFHVDTYDDPTLTVRR